MSFSSSLSPNRSSKFSVRAVILSTGLGRVFACLAEGGELISTPLLSSSLEPNNRSKLSTFLALSFFTLTSPLLLAALAESFSTSANFLVGVGRTLTVPNRPPSVSSSSDESNKPFPPRFCTGLATEGWDCTFFLLSGTERISSSLSLESNKLKSATFDLLC